MNVNKETQDTELLEVTGSQPQCGATFLPRGAASFMLEQQRGVFFFFTFV